MPRHIERHHKDQMKNAEISVVCAKQAVFHNANPFSRHDEAMKLLAHAWCENLHPPALADSLAFSEFVACISKDEGYQNDR